MNNAAISTEGKPPPAWSNEAVIFALKVLDEIKRDNWELSILFCDDKKIKELNRQYREKDEPTDVLSFVLGESIKENGKTTYFPGDIVISLDTLRENASNFQIPEDEELRRLLIHGILHLDGMDHGTINKDEPMLILQEEILNKLSNERIIPPAGGIN
ncbi:MAG: rRNA maturation RNase YbeY [Treponema sp.]|jgi:probable rRNA maturation factor|nr:rRNA maturation RNase YbeY [Treponema sp.]